MSFSRRVINNVIPKNIINENTIKLKKYDISDIPKIFSSVIDKNIIHKSFIGRGFYQTKMPDFIIRNVLENPVWYSAYTPYQAEISQGRLESLFNYQTMICEITGLDISNASLLDEASAVSEAMLMVHNYNNAKDRVFLVDNRLHPQNIYNLNTRAKNLNIKLIYFDKQDLSNIYNDKITGIIIQNPDTEGNLIDNDYRLLEFINQCKNNNTSLIEVSDLMNSMINNSANDNNFDISVGSTQRFGLPMFYGGPHSGFLACKNKFLRFLPGRLVGKSIDTLENEAFRLSLQTREQHIKKEKATSNVCTAQALLANLSTFYGIYHGPKGLTNISNKIYNKTNKLYRGLIDANYDVNNTFFDTLTINFKDNEQYNKILHLAESHKYNFRILSNSKIGISIDELTNDDDLENFSNIFDIRIDNDNYIKDKKDILNQEVFNKYNDENSLIRYIHKLGKKDYSLVDGMIPLGSCTMKLNPTFTLENLTHEKINIHPYAPLNQTLGYQEMINDLSDRLIKITGMDDISFQPNSGSTGEYAGLLAIKGYLNDTNRNICLIPESAHGTNFSSAKLAGYEIKRIKVLSDGSIDIDQMKDIIEANKNKIGALMITYPSTFGIFDENIKDVIKLIHDDGGQVYMDGANMNAQLGWTSPGYIGADVCHLNLHKTFAIPHGGGGPGVGPIAVKKHLSKYLPDITFPNISSAPYGSASILSISWLYLLQFDNDDLKNISYNAIYNANYIVDKIKHKYYILYKKNNLVGHEFIIDCKPFKSQGITEFDIAKRLLDYKFHAPTLSWPIVGTLMIEPTESENIEELDRFISALLSIRDEIDNKPELLKNAPHSLSLLKEDWKFDYSQKDAFYPNNIEKDYFPSVNRVNDVYGDRNIICKY